MKEHRKESHNTVSARAGFSLVEIMLVVAIMGILATVVVVNVRGHSSTARINATRTSIASIGAAIEMYEIQTGQLPDSLADLTRPIGDQPPLIRGGIPTDSWGTPFNYSRQGAMDYEVRSAGPDRQMNTANDITN